jgi:integrase
VPKILVGKIGPMRSKGSRLPKYVYVQHIKGKTYYRFRRGGGPAVRLPDGLGSAEFHAAYAHLLVEPEPDGGRYTEGSVAHTIDRYIKSAEFKQLKEGTRRDYRRYLDRLDNSVGEKPIASLSNDFLFQIRDKLSDRPVAANHTIAVISALFKWAKGRRIVKFSPAAGIPRLKGGEGFERWPDAALESFRASASPMMRLALDLGAYTGQRLSDVIKMKWTDYDGVRIKVVQMKTGTKLSLMAHGDLKAILDATERRGETILTSRSGRPFHSRVFSRDFREARIAAGLPDGLSFHGLRHTAASVMAEVGCTASQIMAVTGHKSLKVAEHYIRQASQETLADRAISSLPTRAKHLN